MTAQLRLVIDRGEAPTHRTSVEYRAKQFYDAYPKHVAWGDVIRAYPGAERVALQDLRAAGDRQATLETAHDAIMAGLARFVFNPKRRLVPHPATWLRARRWMDEPELQQSAQPAPASFEDTRIATWVRGWVKKEAAGWCTHSGTEAPCQCGNRMEREAAMVQKFCPEAWARISAAGNAR